MKRPELARWRPLAGVLAAIAVAETGTRISAVAIPWLVLVTTGSATRTGLVAFCELAPYVVAQALTGPLLDRIGPRRLSWTADLASAAVAALIPLLHLLHALPFWLLPALVAVIGAARGPGDQAKEVIVLDVARHGRLPLERVTGLAGGTDRLATTIGPAAGGVLVAVFDPFTGIAANAACFLLGSVIVGVTLPRGVGRPTPPVAEPEGYWRRFAGGLAFLRQDRLLLTIVAMVGATNLLDQAFSAVLLPVWAHDTGAGAAVLGLTGSVRGLAAVVGSLVAAGVAHRLRRRLVFFAGYLVAGAPRFWVLAAHAPLWTILVVFAVSSVGAGFLNPILGTIPFERVPEHLLGRVLSLINSTAWLGIPLGGLVAGVAVTAVGLTPALLVAGGGYFLVTSLAGLRPEWREMDRNRRAAPSYAPLA
ncbi:MAG TPA: MFS transporter [Pseudonocardiaceae bacterium]|jgi:MFS family permease|nr:MFS transporter [Pseudonocardiaceae bacterium]